MISHYSDLLINKNWFLENSYQSYLINLSCSLLGAYNISAQRQRRLCPVLGLGVPSSV